MAHPAYGQYDQQPDTSAYRAAPAFPASRAGDDPYSAAAYGGRAQDYASIPAGRDMQERNTERVFPQQGQSAGDGQWTSGAAVGAYGAPEGYAQGPPVNDNFVAGYSDYEQGDGPININGPSARASMGGSQYGGGTFEYEDDDEPPWYRRKAGFIAIIVLGVVALIVALGVGIGVGMRKETANNAVDSGLSNTAGTGPKSISYTSLYTSNVVVGGVTSKYTGTLVVPFLSSKATAATSSTAAYVAPTTTTYAAAPTMTTSYYQAPQATTTAASTTYYAPASSSAAYIDPAASSAASSSTPDQSTTSAAVPSTTATSAATTVTSAPNSRTTSAAATTASSDIGGNAGGGGGNAPANPKVTTETAAVSMSTKA